MSDFEIKYQEFIDWLNQHYNLVSFESQVKSLFTKKWGIKYLVTRVGELVNVITVLVAIIENFSNDVKSLDNSEKRELAVEYLDNLIKLPWYLESIDGPIIGIAVGWAVSKAKTLFQWGATVSQSDLDTVRV